MMEYKQLFNYTVHFGCRLLDEKRLRTALERNFGADEHQQTAEDPSAYRACLPAASTA